MEMGLPDCLLSLPVITFLVDISDKTDNAVRVSKVTEGYRLF